MKPQSETPVNNQTQQEQSSDNGQNTCEQDVANWLEAERQLRGKLEREPTHDEIVPLAEEIWRGKNKVVDA